MSETKFPCAMVPDRDSLLVAFDASDRILIECKERKSVAGAFLDREQVESLRDQLTEWLEN